MLQKICVHVANFWIVFFPAVGLGFLRTIPPRWVLVFPAGYSPQWVLPRAIPPQWFWVSTGDIPPGGRRFFAVCHRARTRRTRSNNDLFVAWLISSSSVLRLPGTSIGRLFATPLCISDSGRSQIFQTGFGCPF